MLMSSVKSDRRMAWQGAANRGISADYVSELSRETVLSYAGVRSHIFSFFFPLPLA